MKPFQGGRPLQAKRNRQQELRENADYLLAVKENQGYLYEDIACNFDLYLQATHPLQYVDRYAKAEGGIQAKRLQCAWDENYFL